MNLEAFVRGIGVLGPGFSNWPDAAAVLSGRRDYVPQPTMLPTPSLLPPTERRRTGRVVKLALAIASEAVAHAGIASEQLRSVFSSSGGDGHNCHEICQALASETREVSPTRFANSVHNASAGYWSIATGATWASTVLCAFDGSFCAGLLEAVTQVSVDREPVLLVAYDTEYPDPLHAKRPVPDAFGMALVLTPSRDERSAARIEAALEAGPAETLQDSRLEALRRTIPAARSLPLIRQLALGEQGRVILDYLDVWSLAVDVTPCR
jgi:Beta-ketoacyl synthase, N-terminal domain